MASEIEALPDGEGNLELTSVVAWVEVAFPVCDLKIVQEAFVAG